MKKHQLLALLGVCIIFLLCLVGCTASKAPSESSTDSTASSAAHVISESNASLDTAAEVPKQEASNMVDEKFELLSLVFRLAGR